jgi:hypothetical protein
VIRARVEVALERALAQAERQSLERAVIGGGERQHASGSQDATRLREPSGRVGDVLDHLSGPHHVKARALQRELAFGLDQADVQAGVTPACTTHGLRRDVDGDHLGSLAL